MLQGRGPWSTLVRKNASWCRFSLGSGFFTCLTGERYGKTDERNETNRSNRSNRSNKATKATKSTRQPTDKPNILIIWGDDIGIANLSCYTRGLMGYQTPNIDRIANEGMLFTDSYGEQSCTAGRASFITGQSGYRTGLTKVGIPGITHWPAGGRCDDR